MASRPQVEKLSLSIIIRHRHCGSWILFGYLRGGRNLNSKEVVKNRGRKEALSTFVPAHPQVARLGTALIGVWSPPSSQTKEERCLGEAEVARGSCRSVATRRPTVRAEQL